jgi:phosphoglycerate dehydrogenase-like enzyme
VCRQAGSIRAAILPLNEGRGTGKSNPFFGSAIPGLSGKILGVRGLGDIGEQVAQIALVFGTEVIAWSQNMTSAEPVETGVNARRGLSTNSV